MLSYLSSVNCIINVDENDYDELCQYELSRPFLSQNEKQENVNMINKIFALKTE
ncbi:MAG: hypothetical protein LIO62_05550 [Clostridiales bacterium]|nr:hypothetical protein [Clostridiales bacterium]